MERHLHFSSSLKKTISGQTAYNRRIGIRQRTLCGRSEFATLPPNANASTLAATNYFTTMQYGRFRPDNHVNFEISAASIGKLLKHEFEQRRIATTLPTAADWGYTFRVGIRKQLIDISVVDQGEDGYGIALEPKRKVLNIFFNHDQEKAIQGVKSLLSEVLSAVLTGSTLIWYSKDEWLSAFDTNFWQHQN